MLQFYNKQLVRFPNPSHMVALLIYIINLFLLFTMKNKLYAFVLVWLVWASCARDEKPQPISANELEPLPTSEINAQIKAHIAEYGSFDWSEASDYLLWSAVVHANNMVSVGYGETPDGEALRKSSSNDKELILNMVRESEELLGYKKTDKDVLVYDDPVLTTIDLRVMGIETLQELRNAAEVRYVEPAGYTFFAFAPQKKSASGCNTDADAINSADYRLIAPNAYVSWVFDKHNIPAAWNYSTGQGITVGLIDTGVSQSQPLLNAEFNDGYSSGRTIQRYGTYVDSFWPWVTKTDGPWDKCSHGTSMASTIASPRNNNYMPVGVAYNANLVSYRGTGDVVLDGYHEQVGVADALTALANRSDVKVISMSIGHIISIGRISDAVKYAYGKGKLIIAAGGTSTSWTNFAGVIFPASMSETVAVTGITDGAGYTECEVCHKGDKIDFTVIMQRASNSDRTSPTVGYYSGTKQYVGGSSVSTSTTAGIAALVWARHPSWTRSQVLQKMKESASLYPNKSSNFGYGNINALLAVQ